MSLPRDTYPRSVSVAFRPAEKVWLCLTTLHHRRFIEDAIHVVSLPEGTHMRLRYRRPYISPSLWGYVSAGGSSEGTFALIALGATSSQGQNVVNPLRKASLVAARCEGNVLIIDVVLREYLVNLPSSASFWSEAQLIADELPAIFADSAKFGESGKKSGIYLQELRSPPQALSASSGIDGWEATASAFFEVAAASDDSGDQWMTVPFLYHLAGPAHSLRGQLERGVLDLEAGCSMLLEVHTMADPAKKGPFLNALGEVFFELSHSAATFSSSRRVRVDSRRDVRAVQIASPALFRRAHGHLSVRMVIFDNSDVVDESAGNSRRSIASSKKRDETVISRYDYPLRVGRSTPIIASLLVAAAAALATFKPPGPTDGSHPYVISGLVFVLGLVGLMLGLRKDGKS